ncbi:hypothetical protein MCA1726 [Methylococcus capsulatus str. Bath]|uniref:Uncharacterized protein n=1 Tax=Methylococcus capsulatus (strain ATCC 33009 / NCIMB 11132 / Bath) TaxID=243233 RepID=Q607N3_METCA|nr:hypothetical protein MCA1726 [Methylococcus capsulatus str. Bath]
MGFMGVSETEGKGSLRFFAGAEQPIYRPQGQQSRGQGTDGCGTDIRIENDELARQRDQGDQYHRLDLNDAAAAQGRPQDGMLEFHRDQQGHDHAEQFLKHRMIERFENPAGDQHGDGANELIERDDDDHRDHVRQNDCNHLLETLIEIHQTPFFGKGRTSFHTGDFRVIHHRFFSCFDTDYSMPRTDAPACGNRDNRPFAPVPMAGRRASVAMRRARPILRQSVSPARRKRDRSLSVSSSRSRMRAATSRLVSKSRLRRSRRRHRWISAAAKRQAVASAPCGVNTPSSTSSAIQSIPAPQAKASSSRDNTPSSPIQTPTPATMILLLMA